MNTDRPNFTAEWINGLMTLVLAQPGDEVRAGPPRGERAGDEAISSAVEKAISSTVKRARELLQAIRAADHAEVTEKAKLVEVAREKVRASAVLFGEALTTRLAEIDRQHDTATVQLHRAENNRQDAIRELERLRDSVTKDGPKEVRDAVRDRQRTATAERERSVQALLAALAPHLTAVLALDAELDVLEGVRTGAAVRKALVAALPEVFGTAGMVGLERYDPSANRPEPKPATDPRQVRYLPGWRRPGHEAEYGVKDGAWEER